MDACASRDFLTNDQWRQKLNLIPVSILLPGIAAVGPPKRGDVSTPEKPIVFT